MFKGHLNTIRNPEPLSQKKNFSILLSFETHTYILHININKYTTIIIIWHSSKSYKPFIHEYLVNTPLSSEKDKNYLKSSSTIFMDGSCVLVGSPLYQFNVYFTFYIFLSLYLTHGKYKRYDQDERLGRVP